MSKSERQSAVGSGQSAVRTARRKVFYCLLLTAYCLLLFGCRQDMQDQPRYEAYEASTFFKDGLASRPIVEGTVPRGFLRTDTELYTGQTAKPSANTSATATPSAAGAGQQASASANTSGQQTGGTAEQPAGTENDLAAFPFPVTTEVMERGRERYEIFCALCHGHTGDGDGMIVKRGFRNPPSYHEPRLRDARVGYYFRVMTEGLGAMASYQSQIPVQDRWAIAAYIRALQLSRANQKQAEPAPSPAHSTGAETGGHE